MVRVHSAIPPSRCFTLCSPAAFNVVSAWADRIPLLQYRTISLSSGSWARPAAEPISPLGIKMLPGMCAMSNSAALARRPRGSSGPTAVWFATHHN